MFDSERKNDIWESKSDRSDDLNELLDNLDLEEEEKVKDSFKIDDEDDP